MTVTEVKRLPVRDKLQLMEAIWEDLRSQFEESEISQSHRDLLDARRERVKSGDTHLLDWDEAKSLLGRG